jgi:hypothetical protein
MAIYRYALHKDAGPNEHLGFIEIPSDAEAMAFGREVLVDIMREPGPEQAGASLEITEGARQVDSVPLEMEVRRKAYG